MKGVALAGALLAVGPQSIPYLDAADWRQASAGQKIALAADFMRVFCARPRMPPDALAACLDATAVAGPVFPRAMDCAGTIER
jgi:hypothetical protein